MAYKEIGIKNFWKPEQQGAQLEGKVTSIEETKYGKQYDIQTENDGTLTTPSHKVLENRMATVKEGDQILITYEGEEPNDKGNPTKIYKVEKDQ